jgi:FecR protein
MNMVNYVKVVGVVTLSLALPVFAQDEQPVVQPAVEPAAEVPQVGAVADPAATNKPPAKIFDILARVQSPRGIAEVNNPDVGSFQPAIGNKAYPLGSTFRTGPNSSVVINFSNTDGVQLLENTEVVVHTGGTNEAARSVTLVRGQLRTYMKDSMPEEMFSVSTPNAICKSLAGRAEFGLGIKDGNEELSVATITGSLLIEGLQFKIPTLRAANTVNVLTATNRSLSRLISEKGDFKVVLSTGTEFPVTYDISPRAVIKIWREAAPIGGRTVVSTLVVGPSGTAQHRFVYAVGRDALATGELVDKTVLEQQEKTLRTLGGALTGQQAPTTQQPKEEVTPAEEKKPVEAKPPTP